MFYRYKNGIRTKCMASSDNFACDSRVFKYAIDNDITMADVVILFNTKNAAVEAVSRDF